MQRNKGIVVLPVKFNLIHVCLYLPFVVKPNGLSVFWNSCACQWLIVKFFRSVSLPMFIIEVAQKLKVKTFEAKLAVMPTWIKSQGCKKYLKGQIVFQHLSKYLYVFPKPALKTLFVQYLKSKKWQQGWTILFLA